MTHAKLYDALCEVNREVDKIAVSAGTGAPKAYLSERLESLDEMVKSIREGWGA